MRHQRVSTSPQKTQTKTVHKKSLKQKNLKQFSLLQHLLRTYAIDNQQRRLFKGLVDVSNENPD